ncbi:PREDICTED: UDP-N-acetylglucosamine/UDP-glucose/GDP-mannose transporter [Nanorana parkeri]|uniref:UDP-N-acetylglucosamine/UDP-glucose/GDP-mannose transporter n=1 Tax=Nanorana parkeri TaxID=125878 RepID=UPI0008543292|nr:PREDICTED: UDP-N-acetylglucosamine/UDP-glucose/GDP-mannose transporter [Nanorana parkeri]
MAASIEVPASRTARLLSALFYGLTSFLIVLVNKSVLTAYRFPASTFLAVGQMGFTIVILYTGKTMGFITFPDFDRQIPRKLFPLPLLYIGNHLTGLLSTQKLSLPMFSVLRKFSILFTLILEMIILRKRYSLSVALSVSAMMIGAFIAASFDLTFNLEGYCIVLLNDLFTASYGVYTKEKINPKELGTFGVLFYNATFMLLPALVLTVWTGEFEKATQYTEWTNIYFAFQFLLSCSMGFLLVYAIVLCSYYNSALTTTVIGALKNVSIAYIGIFLGGDYSFSWLNFLGLNICMAGGVAYSFVTLWAIPKTTESIPKTAVWDKNKRAVSQRVESDTHKPNVI